MIDSIRAPAQARSRATMGKIYTSLDELLKVNSFDRITIADLASHADVATGSIYARFADKNALIAGLHKHISDEARECFLDFTTPEEWKSVGTEDLVLQLLKKVIGFYRRNQHILRAAVLADVPVVYENMSRVWQAAVERMSELLAPRMPSATAEQREDAVRFCIRIVTATMHQSMLIRDVRTLHKGMSDKVLIQHLTVLICGYLTASGLTAAQR